MHGWDHTPNYSAYCYGSDKFGTIDANLQEEWKCEDTPSGKIGSMYDGWAVYEGKPSGQPTLNIERMSEYVGSSLTVSVQGDNYTISGDSLLLTNMKKINNVVYHKITVGDDKTLANIFAIDLGNGSMSIINVNNSQFSHGVGVSRKWL